MMPGVGLERVQGPEGAPSTRWSPKHLRYECASPVLWRLSSPGCPYCGTPGMPYRRPCARPTVQYQPTRPTYGRGLHVKPVPCPPPLHHLRPIVQEDVGANPRQHTLAHTRPTYGRRLHVEPVPGPRPLCHLRPVVQEDVCWRQVLAVAVAQRLAGRVVAVRRQRHGAQLELVHGAGLGAWMGKGGAAYAVSW